MLELADGPEQFLAKLDKALENQRKEAAAHRMERVAASGWDAPVAEVLKVAYARLENKGVL